LNDSQNPLFYEEKTGCGFLWDYTKFMAIKKFHKKTIEK
jgi:hypothetical protein